MLIMRYGQTSEGQSLSSIRFSDFSQQNSYFYDNSFGPQSEDTGVAIAGIFLALARMSALQENVCWRVDCQDYFQLY